MKPVDTFTIQNTVFWVKVVGFLQHNWAVIEEVEQNKIKIFFFDDNAQVFDELDFELLDDADKALARNGFDLWEDEDNAFKANIPKPQQVFSRGKHPNGPIYSSGRFWV